MRHPPVKPFRQCPWARKEPAFCDSDLWGRGSSGVVYPRGGCCAQFGALLELLFTRCQMSAGWSQQRVNCGIRALRILPSTSPGPGQVGESWLSLSLGKVLTSDAIVISVQPVWVPFRSASGNETGLRFLLGLEILTIEIRPVWIVWVARIGWCGCRCGRVGRCRSGRAGCRCGRVGGCRADRDVIRDRKRNHVDAYVHERRVDPAALPFHAAEVQPGAGGVAGVDIEPFSLAHRGYYGAERPRPFSHIGSFNCDDKVRSWNRR